jgi:hypothetical protein
VFRVINRLRLFDSQRRAKDNNRNPRFRLSLVFATERFEPQE